MRDQVQPVAVLHGDAGDDARRIGDDARRQTGDVSPAASVRCRIGSFARRNGCRGRSSPPPFTRSGCPSPAPSPAVDAPDHRHGFLHQLAEKHRIAGMAAFQVRVAQHRKIHRDPGPDRVQPRVMGPSVIERLFSPHGQDAALPQMKTVKGPDAGRISMVPSCNRMVLAITVEAAGGKAASSCASRGAVPYPRPGPCSRSSAASSEASTLMTFRGRLASWKPSAPSPSPGIGLRWCVAGFRG